ncbi:MAG TPA: hypothetical protein VIH25_04015 [Steroidobacteraceae bacterium]
MISQWADQLIAAVYRYRMRSRYSGEPLRNHRIITNPWHAVSIVTGPIACENAVQRHGERLLSADAPPLPLANCQNPTRCTCHYRHHTDRRGKRRRGRDNGLSGSGYSGVERRKTEHGRRATDL